MISFRPIFHSFIAQRKLQKRLRLCQQLKFSIRYISLYPDCLT